MAVSILCFLLGSEQTRIQLHYIRTKVFTFTSQNPLLLVLVSVTGEEVYYTWNAFLLALIIL